MPKSKSNEKKNSKRMEARSDVDVVDDSTVAMYFDGVEVHVDPNQSDFGSSEDEDEQNEQEMLSPVNVNAEPSLVRGSITENLAAGTSKQSSNFNTVLQDAGFQDYFSKMVDEKIAMAKQEWLAEQQKGRDLVNENGNHVKSPQVVNPQVVMNSQSMKMFSPGKNLVKSP